MDSGVTIYDRLEQFAVSGKVDCELNLYNRQAEKLLREGFAVQRGLPIPGWKGQYRCRIGWRYALPHTFAWELLEIASDNNPDLRKALSDSDCEDIAPPYRNGWTF